MRTKSFFVSWVALLFVASVLAAGQAQETVLYSFGTNANDGSTPNGGLVFDDAGNLYGTTQRGGAYAGGTVFELTPAAGGTWSETVLYNFCAQTGCLDGGVPKAGLILDSGGNLYGTAAVGGAFSGGTCRGAGCGTVFELSPPSAPGGSWTETVLWNFGGDLKDDGAQPVSRLNWDAEGNLYGTTINGGSSASSGTVFELSPNSGGGWAESVLYAFCKNGPPCPDGIWPMAGVSFDTSGNLYGTAFTGAYDGQWGTVYRLSPQPGGAWSETTLHRFTPQGGGNPLSVVNVDSAGNLYGTVSSGRQGGPAQCGGVWRLTPQGNGFKARMSPFNPSGANGCGPAAGLHMDRKGNAAFGTTSTGGSSNGGTVFKMTRNKQTVLYDFCQQPGCADGSKPIGSVTARGAALFSTTSKGGAFNQGVVFEITP